MRIAIASGKGGTGKTTVATNLAHVAARNGRSVAYLDCDVEEPNGHIFLRPRIQEERSIEKPVPVVDPARCEHCGQCARACRYGAVASLPDQTLIFAELCHACGGCVLVCPAEAIHEQPRTIGRLRLGVSGPVRFVEGELNVGEAMSPPAIRVVKAAAPEAELILLDAPPGTSCPVVESVRGCDLVVLVTEPTPFGLNDLALAVEMVQTMRLPMGVVINRANLGNGKVREFCAGHRIPVFAEIPDDRAVAEAYSRGQMVAEAVPGFADRIGQLLNRIEHGNSVMKELVVISGKGGTGKTSLVAAFAQLAKPVVLADCDVDAPDLHLVLQPRITRREYFFGGSKARIKPGHCTACGKCEELCRFDAIFFDGPGNGRVARTFRVDELACEGCGVCFDFCAEDAIEFKPDVCGQLFVSETRCGPMVHARLKAAAENSGKLVTRLRQAGQQMAAAAGLDLVICDGSPGIGCPVIASLTGATLAVIVVEPTASGLHDFKRIAQLVQRLDVPGLLVVNKADLNADVADRLEHAARARNIEPVGRVPYDLDVTRAEIEARSVVEASTGPAAAAVRTVWQKVDERLRRCTASESDLVQLEIN